MTSRQTRVKISKKGSSLGGTSVVAVSAETLWSLLLAPFLIFLACAATAARIC